MRLSPFALFDRLTPVIGPDPAGWLRGGFFAHRGLHGAFFADCGLHGRGVLGNAPENSPEAFAAAIGAGYGIECDVQLTADGEAVVFHDFTLDRLTGASGAVRDRTAAELGEIMLTGGGAPIPTLAQVLAQVGGRVPLLIEVKMRAQWPVAPLAAAVARALAGYQGAHGVMSFDPRVPQWFARHAPDTPRGLVRSEGDHRSGLRWITRQLSLRTARAQFLALDIRDLPSRFAAAQTIPIASWTVRSPELLARARAAGVTPIAEAAGIPLASGA